MEPEIIFKQDGKVITKIDFSVVPIELPKIIDIQVENIGNVDLEDIEFITKDQQLKVIEYPQVLRKNSEGILKIKYTPDTLAKKGLDTSIVVAGKYRV